MWTCPDCGRIFEKTKQPHSCHKVSLETHFKNKYLAKELFDTLIAKLRKDEKIEIISLPCCIHLYGRYDFLAALPKRHRLEIRFAMDHVIKSHRLKQSFPLSSKYYKNCIDIDQKEQIDKELLAWIGMSYHLKD